MKMWVQSLAWLNGLRIQRCRKLQCRLQMWLRSGVAVAVASPGSCSSDLTPSLGTSIRCRCSPKQMKEKKKEREGWREEGIERRKEGRRKGGMKEEKKEIPQFHCLHCINYKIKLLFESLIPEVSI